MKRGVVWSMMLFGLMLSSGNLVWAGDVGKFGDSLRKGGGSSSSHDDDNDDDELPDLSPEDIEMILHMLKFAWGHVPGEQFTYGSSPYHGRYGVDELAQYASNGEVYQSEGVALGPRVEAEVGAGVIGTTSLDGMGGSVYGRLSSVYTPSLEFGFMSINDIEEGGATLRLVELTVQPNLVLFEQGRLYWSIGGSHFADEEGTIGGALTLGLGADLYLYEPFTLKVRGQYHNLGGAQVLDGSLKGGVQVSTHAFLEAGVRAFGIDGGESLVMPTIGVSWQWGL